MRLLLMALIIAGIFSDSTQLCASANYLYEDSSDAYAAICLAYAKKENPTGDEHRAFYEKVYDFAAQGEIAAVDTLLSTYRDNPTKTTATLRGLLRNNPNNVYATILLARQLVNANDAGCLELYEHLVTSKADIPDTDFWPNYVDALFRLKKPLNLETLTKCRELLDAWPFSDDDDSDAICLHTHYFHLASQARKLQLNDFLSNLVRWSEETKRHPVISDALAKALAGTGLMNNVKTIKSYPSAAELETLIAHTHQCSTEIGAQRQLDERIMATVEKIILENLKNLQINAQVNLIPYSQTYQDRFAGFNPHKPSWNHLKIWATLIAETYQRELLTYNRKGYGELNTPLNAYFTKLKKSNLISIIGSALTKAYDDLE